MPGLGVARISRLAICIVLIALGVTQPSWVEVNAAGVTLTSNITVNTTLTLTSGKVNLGSNTLTISSSGG